MGACPRVLLRKSRLAEGQSNRRKLGRLRPSSRFEGIFLTAVGRYCYSLSCGCFVFFALVSWHTQGHEADHRAGSAVIAVTPLLSEPGLACARVKRLGTSASYLDFGTHCTNVMASTDDGRLLSLGTEVNVVLLSASMEESGLTHIVNRYGSNSPQLCCELTPTERNEGGVMVGPDTPELAPGSGFIVTYNSLLSHPPAFWNMLIFAVSAYLQLPERAVNHAMTSDTLQVTQNNQSIHFRSAAGGHAGDISEHIVPCVSTAVTINQRFGNDQSNVPPAFGFGRGGDEPPDERQSHTRNTNCPLCGGGRCKLLDRKKDYQRRKRGKLQDKFDELAECLDYERKIKKYVNGGHVTYQNCRKTPYF